MIRKTMIAIVIKLYVQCVVLVFYTSATCEGKQVCGKRKTDNRLLCYLPLPCLLNSLIEALLANQIFEMSRRRLEQAACTLAVLFDFARHILEQSCRTNRREKRENMIKVALTVRRRQIIKEHQRSHLCCLCSEGRIFLWPGIGAER